MRAQGSGSVSWVANRNKWRVRVRVEGVQRQVGLFVTREDAEEALAAVLARLPETSSSSRLTLASWGARWLDQRETDGVHRSVDGDRSVWRSRVATSSLYAQPLDLLSASDVREWVRLQLRTPSKRTGRPPNRQTVQNALNLLRVCLEDALQQGLLASNPSREVRLPRGASARSDDPWDWLRQDELERLWSCKSLKDPHRGALEVAVYTGLRAGELWGLRWEDVDLDACRIAVRYSYRSTTKTGKVRHVPLLLPALLALKRRSRGRVRRGLVWPARDGGCHRKGYTAQLERCLQDAGITRHVRFHDLRHTCASHLVQGTWGRVWSLAEVGQLLGHSSSHTTQRYAHLSPDGLSRAARETFSGEDHSEAQ